MEKQRPKRKTKPKKKEEEEETSFSWTDEITSALLSFMQEEPTPPCRKSGAEPYALVAEKMKRRGEYLHLTSITS